MRLLKKHSQEPSWILFAMLILAYIYLRNEGYTVLLQRLGHSPLSWLFEAASFLPLLLTLYYVIPMAVILLGREQHQERKAKAAALVAAFFLTLFLTHLLKILFHQPRPGNLQVSYLGFQDYSFPSGHAAFAFAALPLLRRILSRGLFSAAVAYSVLVAVSRVVLGFHYAFDIGAGALLGFAVGHYSTKLIYLPALSSGHNKEEPHAIKTRD